MGQPSSRVLVRFLLESSTGPAQSFWYCIEQGNFSRLCRPMAQRSPQPRKSPCTMENMEAADSGEPVTQRCFKAAVAHALPPCSLLGEMGGWGRTVWVWDLASSSLRSACLACPLWTMLDNCFKALPGTVAAKTLVSSQAAHRRAGHLTGTPGCPIPSQGPTGPAEPVII